ncbi:class II aldolase/adducin family protein [Rhodococcoides kroppenstedtii]|uniref:class II aldolase/adducin family protein n=1 Tax=Rhodococcoides kroppenstedtii TaxID=293050 RepID=UPI00353021D9
MNGDHLDGAAPTKESFLHLAMYRARPGSGAVVHTPSTHSVAVSCLADLDTRNALAPLTAYYAMRVGRLPLLPSHAPGDPALGPLAETVAAEHHAARRSRTRRCRRRSPLCRRCPVSAHEPRRSMGTAGTRCGAPGAPARSCSRFVQRDPSSRESCRACSWSWPPGAHYSSRRPPYPRARWS